MSMDVRACVRVRVRILRRLPFQINLLKEKKLPDFGKKNEAFSLNFLYECCNCYCLVSHLYCENEKRIKLRLRSSELVCRKGDACSHRRQCTCSPCGSGTEPVRGREIKMNPIGLATKHQTLTTGHGIGTTTSSVSLFIILRLS